MEAFLTVCQQWRVGPLGGLLGFDYPGVEALLRMSEIEVNVDLLADLRIMEGAALAVLNANQRD